MIAVLLALALFWRAAASAWVDSLYGKNRDILEYPARPGRSWRGAFLTGSFFLLALWLSAQSSGPGDFLARFLLGNFLCLTLVTDFEQHLIFDRMLLPLGLCALPFFCVLGWPVLSHALGAIAGGGLFFLLALLTRWAIGGGDVKLVFLLGLWLGAEAMVRILAGGFILSGLAAGVMLLLGRWGLQERFAYSPYFSLLALWEIAG